MIKSAVFACLCIFASSLSADQHPSEQYTRSEQLSYDPFYVLPSQRGYKSIDVGMRGNDVNKPGKTTNFFLMSKFTPGDKVEVGAQLTFGFLNESASNFSSLMVGSKYSLGPQRAAAINLLMPAGDIKNPGISLGFMNSITLGEQFEINKQLFWGFLKGYTGGGGMVIDALIEPVLVIDQRWVAYFDIKASSNTDGIGDHLSVNGFPNIDLVISDGNVLNVGVQFGLIGELKSDATSLYVTLLRTM